MCSAEAWRSALCSASCAMRNTSVWIAAGQSPASRGRSDGGARGAARRRAWRARPRGPRAPGRGSQSTMTERSSSIASPASSPASRAVRRRRTSRSSSARRLRREHNPEELLRDRVVQLRRSRLRSSTMLSSRLRSCRRAFSIASAACAANGSMSSWSLAEKPPSLSVR